jgi:mannose-1-phosphate guanylyltransferase
MEHYYAVIMAGGGGTRLWPLSRQSQPKQSLKLLGERTMFQIAVERLQPLFPPERVLVVTNAAYAVDLQQQCPQLPSENFIIEPAPRGTAPAIALSALAVRQRDPHGVMACLTADHFIADEARFRAVLTAAARAAGQGFLVTLGIAPSFAATGYGYIQRGPSLGAHEGFDVYRAARFREKPDRATAEAMLADGLHSWNSGMFIWRVDRILAEFARQMPDFYKLLLAIEAAPAQLPALWAQAPNTTIDYGIMEGADEVAVIPAQGLGWSDIGSWDSLLDVLPPDENGNVVVGVEHVGVGSRGTLIHAGSGPHKLIATIGVQDLVIVDTGDVLLVCSRERAQDVRAVVDALKKRADGKQYL